MGSDGGGGGSGRGGVASGTEQEERDQPWTSGLFVQHTTRQRHSDDGAGDDRGGYENGVRDVVQW